MATLSITVPDGAVPRIRAAFRDVKGLDHLPTNAELQDFLRTWVRDVVVRAEQVRLTSELSPTAEANVSVDFPAS